MTTAARTMRMFVDGDDAGPVEGVTFSFDSVSDEPARLPVSPRPNAAQGMARLLLKGMDIVLAAGGENVHGCLGGCRGYGPKASDHDPDCLLVAELRAAGVLP